MYWNFRIFKHAEDDYRLHECFYDEGKDVPHSRTEDAISISGGSVEDIIWTLKQMLKDAKLPVMTDEELDKDSETLVEWGKLVETLESGGEIPAELLEGENDE